MTLQELHNTAKFSELFGDPRFRAAIAYLREHPEPKRNHGLVDATSIIRSEGVWHGWFDALEKLEALGKPPVDVPGVTRGRPYVNPQQTE